MTRTGKPVVTVTNSDSDYRTLKLQALRAALVEGEQSGDAGILDMKAIRQKAKRLAK